MAWSEWKKFGDSLTFITHGHSMHENVTVTINDYDKIILFASSINNASNLTLTVTLPEDVSVEFDTDNLVYNFNGLHEITRAIVISGIKGKSLTINAAWAGGYIVFGM